MLRTLGLATFLMLGGVALTGCAQNTTSAGQQSASGPQSTVDSAASTVGTMTNSGGAKSAALLQQAKAVLIFPDLINGGIGIGGSRGQGVLVARRAGTWSGPAFYESTSFSLGLQLGLQSSSVVMFVISQKALDTLLQPSSFTFKAGGGLSLADFNSATQAQLTGADVVVWSQSSGAFAGLTVSGTTVSQRTDNDMAYYQKSVSASDIVAGKVKNANDRVLISALGH